MSASYRMPPGFEWGAATAAYQIEGAAREDGRGDSVWDAFCRIPGRVQTGESGDVACDHYHRYEEDVALLAALGARTYRFSIAWPRILPEGTGPVNERGFAFYERLLDALLARGIEPQVTLFHWDGPQALEDRYGSWRSRRMAQDFADYAAIVVKRLGDRVRRWTTMNEIACFTWMGYDVGRPGLHAPGTAVASRREVWQTVHHALLAHGLGVQAIRASSPRPCSVSLVDNPHVPVPVTEAEDDLEAARRAVRNLVWNGGILVPAVTGAYGEAWWAERVAAGEAPEVEAGDLGTIAQPLDAIGLNVYTGTYVRAAPATGAGWEVVALPRAYPRMDMEWLHFVPDAIYWAPRLVREALGYGGDFFVSENGCATPDQIAPSGEVLDLDRVLYLRSYLRQVHRAVDEGLPVRAYYVWSLLDNFEWSYGYSKRFGIVHTAYESQRRLPKASARWYSECIRQHRVV